MQFSRFIVYLRIKEKYHELAGTSSFTWALIGTFPLTYASATLAPCKLLDVPRMDQSKF